MAWSRQSATQDLASSPQTLPAQPQFSLPLAMVVTCLRVLSSLHPPAGQDLVPIPAGSNNVLAVVVGAGGASSLAPSGGTSGFGGTGRNVTTIMRFPNETAYLRVIVGAAGTRTPGATVSAGSGGKASSLAAVDAFGNVVSLLVIAGGGGGAGTCVNFRFVSAADDAGRPPRPSLT